MWLLGRTATSSLQATWSTVSHEARYSYGREPRPPVQRLYHTSTQGKAVRNTFFRHGEAAARVLRLDGGDHVHGEGAHGPARLRHPRGFRLEAMTRTREPTLEGVAGKDYMAVEAATSI